MSLPTDTSTAGSVPFPFDDTDALIDEEQALPIIPPFPSIWTSPDKMNKTDNTDWYVLG